MAGLVKSAVKAIAYLSTLVFLVSVPWFLWLYHHRPHVPQPPYIARLPFGNVMYLLPWERNALAWMVLGSWAVGLAAGLLWQVVRRDDDTGVTPVRLLAAGIVAAFVVMFIGRV